MGGGATHGPWSQQQQAHWQMGLCVPSSALQVGKRLSRVSIGLCCCRFLMPCTREGDEIGQEPSALICFLCGMLSDTGRALKGIRATCLSQRSGCSFAGIAFGTWPDLFMPYQVTQACMHTLLAASNSDLLDHVCWPQVRDYSLLITVAHDCVWWHFFY